jgi:putative two-component system response regulator
MKLHTIYGALILSSIPGEIGKAAMLTALLHHEKYNGQGYWVIKTSTLPDFIGIVGICDVYCALVSCREYKSAWSHDKALHYIISRAGRQFCPSLVADFILLF